MGSGCDFDALFGPAVVVVAQGNIGIDVGSLVSVLCLCAKRRFEGDAWEGMYRQLRFGLCMCSGGMCL